MLLDMDNPTARAIRRCNMEWRVPACLPVGEINGQLLLLDRGMLLARLA